MVEFTKPQRLGQILGWDQNPFYQAFDANRNAVIGGFAGLGAIPGNPGTGFSQGFANGMQLDQQAADKRTAQEKQNQTSQMLRQKGATQLADAIDNGNLSGIDAWQLWYEGQNQPAGDSLMSVGGHIYDKSSGQWISPPETADNRQNVSLTGQWGRDQQGNPVYLQPTSTGEMLQSEVPAGVELLGPYDTSADRAAGTAFGRNTGSAQFDLPAAQLTTQQTLQAIENVRNNTAGMDEQFGNILGVPQQMTPAWPGSAKANFQVDTNRLINRTFLEAREVLRGGGQITDFESRKAEGAISSLEEAMQKGDRALFERSLAELEQAVRDGLAKLQAQSQVIPGYGSGRTTQAPAASNVTSGGVQWSIEP